MNIESLSNKELRSLLQEYGETPGPVTGSTRGVYEILLRSHVSGQRRSSLTAGGRNRSPKRNNRRQTLDTASLRSTQKPNTESRRRTEVIKTSSVFVPDNISLSDLSDAELPPLDLTPEETPDKPPQSLKFSIHSPVPKKRDPKSRSPIRSDKRRSKNPSLFSEDDEPSEKKRKTKKSKKLSYYNIVVAVSLLVLTASIIYTFVVPSFDNEQSEGVVPQCLNIPEEIIVTPKRCNEVFAKLTKEKVRIDVFSGRVECGDEEGELYFPSPSVHTESQLLFHFRDHLNYTIYRKIHDVYFAVETKGDIEDIRSNNNYTYYYRTNTPYVSWYCSVTTIINNFAFYILIAVIVSVMAHLASKVIEWRRSKVKQETGQMYELIDQIIEELQRNYAKYQSDPKNHVPYVPIPHARDRLLLPSERSAMKHIWDRAVQFIAENESRVRVEMRRVQSEDFPVWYWLEASKPTSVTTPQPDSTSDFLYPDLDSDLNEQHKT